MAALHHIPHSWLTWCARLQVEVKVDEDETDTGRRNHALENITIHLWRAELFTSNLEVDRECMIVKTGGSVLREPGLLFGVPSMQMMRTPLHHWVNTPHS